MRRFHALAAALVLAAGVVGCDGTEPGAPLEFAAVSAGGTSACALVVDGPTLCWGDNRRGQLGNGTTTSTPHPTPLVLSPALAAVGASTVSCGLDDAGAALCWGDNEGNKSGSDLPGEAFLTAPQGVLGVPALDTVAVSHHGACGLDRSGVARCWGTTSATPFNGLPVRALALGEFDPCAILADGSLSCLYPEWSLPTNDVPPAIAFGSGERLHCMLDEGGTARCWGLLYVPEDPRRLPQSFVSDTAAELPGERTFTALTVGHEHACGLNPNGFAYCWGMNDVGQLGDGTTAPGVRDGLPAARPVAGGRSFASIAAGDFFTCGLTRSGEIYCWGDNTHGQLGVAEPAISPLPVRVAATLP